MIIMWPGNNENLRVACGSQNAYLPVYTIMGDPSGRIVTDPDHTPPLSYQ
jgi:hypothetical protein